MIPPVLYVFFHKPAEGKPVFGAAFCSGVLQRIMQAQPLVISFLIFPILAEFPACTVYQIFVTSVSQNIPRNSPQFRLQNDRMKRFQFFY